MCRPGIRSRSAPWWQPCSSLQYFRRTGRHGAPPAPTRWLRSGASSGFCLTRRHSMRRQELNSCVRRQDKGMRPLRYSINVTLDGCCDHRAVIANEELHRHAAENIAWADALLFGRVTYEMMEAAWRPPAQMGARPAWMEPFARTIDAAKKYVVSSTLERVDWNAELVRGDLRTAVQDLKRQSGKGL